ncbi:hypothetical protein AAFM79_11165, partial [Trichormus azollae HNT15244]
MRKLEEEKVVERRGFANPEVEGNQPLRGLPPQKRGFWECWSGTQRVYRWMEPSGRFISRVMRLP